MSQESSVNKRFHKLLRLPPSHMTHEPGFCETVGNRKVNKRQRQLQQSIEEALKKR